MTSTMEHRQKTKHGIANARGKGISWGPHGAVLAKQNKAAAHEFAETLRPLIIDLMARRKCRGPVALARALNDRGVKSRNGKTWHPNSVQRVLDRLRPSLDEEVRQARTEIFRNATGTNLTGHSCLIAGGKSND